MVAMLDMSAAFDTVDHAILLKRLQSTFGFQGTVIRWFESYLSERTVRVSINDALSDTLELTCSLPQGSKLGPRLYSDYTQNVNIGRAGIVEQLEGRFADIAAERRGHATGH